MQALIVGNAVVTLILVGLILTIQQVHYPLFAKVGTAEFPAYHASHSTRITVLVMPLMVLELAVATALVVFTPSAISRWSSVAGLALVLVIWLATLLLQVPQHAILGRGWNVHAHASLVASNWVRTWAWISRGALAVWWLFQLA